MKINKLLNFSLMLVRYVVAGFAGIGANLLVFSFLVLRLETWYLAAAVLGFGAAYLVTFLMHKYWTFKSMSKELFYKQSVVYLFSAVITLIINTFILYLLVTHTGANTVLAQFISLLLAAVLSFAFTTQVTFHNNDARIHKFTNYFNFGLMVGIKRERNWLFLLLVISVVLVFLRVSFLPLTFSTDSVTYVATAEHLMGDDTVTIYGERILKPLAPYIVGLLAKTGLSFETALITQAIAMYFLLGFVVYWFGYELFKSSRYAFVTAISVITTYPILRYGLDFMTETGIWFFYFSSLAATIRWSKTPSYKWILVISFSFLAGLLWKEYIVLSGIIFLLVVLTQRPMLWSIKLMTLLQVFFLVLLPWSIWQYHVLTVYEYTYLDWLRIGSTANAYDSEYTLFKISKTLFALLFAAWPLVVYGLFKWKKIEMLPKRFIRLMIVPSFGFLLWGYVSSRLFFSLVPVLAPLIAIGYMSLPNKFWKWGSLMFILIVNCILVTFAFDSHVREILNQLNYGF